MVDQIISCHNITYEKVGKNEPVSIEEELPFEIPNSWEWVRLGSIGEWKSGATPSRSMPKYYDGDIPWLKTGDLNDGYIKYIPEKISQLALEKTSVKLNPIGLSSPMAPRIQGSKRKESYPSRNHRT